MNEGDLGTEEPLLLVLEHYLEMTAQSHLSIPVKFSNTLERELDWPACQVSLAVAMEQCRGHQGVGREPEATAVCVC